MAERDDGERSLLVCVNATLMNESGFYDKLMQRYLGIIMMCMNFQLSIHPNIYVLLNKADDMMSCLFF